jgi:hypothetical protein
MPILSFVTGRPSFVMTADNRGFETAIHNTQQMTDDQ